MAFHQLILVTMQYQIIDNKYDTFPASDNKRICYDR